MINCDSDESLKDDRGRLKFLEMDYLDSSRHVNRTVQTATDTAPLVCGLDKSFSYFILSARGIV